MSKFNFNIDIEELSQQSLSKSKLDNKSQKQLYIDYALVIDLGLPSKTRWYAYNVGVDFGKLDKWTGWRGKYFAWGEIKTKTPNRFKLWINYKFYKDGVITKYQRIDNLTQVQLLPEDDAAHQLVKDGIHEFYMPTKKQCLELIENTTHEEVKNYIGIENLNGFLLTSIHNKNTIFFPYSGYIDRDNMSYRNVCAGLWTSSMLEGNEAAAYSMIIHKGDIRISEHMRKIGLTIRPVVNN